VFVDIYPGRGAVNVNGVNLHIGRAGRANDC
jgi:hypothetical protein